MNGRVGRVSVFYEILPRALRHEIFFAIDNVGVIILRERVHFLQRGRGEHVVDIHEENVFAARKAEALVARRGRGTRIFFHARQYKSPAEFRDITFDNFVA